MKVISLNIQHGGGKRVRGILGYLLPQNADVIVLTEFRENENAFVLRSALAAKGFTQFAAASIGPKENSVCIFSRLPFVARTYPGLAASDRHRVVSAHFKEMAIFGVYFSQNEAKATLFQFFIDGAYKPSEAALIVVGDFNTGLHHVDEVGSTFYCAELFAALPKAGLIDSWRSRNPSKKEFSWFSNASNGFRIDHVFSSPSADSKIQGVYYDHAPRESRITDHSALVFEHVS